MSEGDLEKKAAVETDELLLDLIREGDQLALSRLYDRKSGIIYSMAYGLLGNKHDAEEITEEVFLKIWENAEKFDRARGSVAAWITIIARRLAIDRTRSKQYRSRTREVSIEAVDAGGKLGDKHQESESRMIMAVEAGNISNALDQLNDTHREVIRLSYFEGLSHSKISERLDTPLGTVKTRIRDAVVQLRQILSVEA